MGAKAAAAPLEPGQVGGPPVAAPSLPRAAAPRRSFHSLWGGAEAAAGTPANAGTRQRLLCVSVREIMAAAARTAVPRGTRCEV